MKKIVNHPNDIRLDGIVENDGIGFLPIREMEPTNIGTPGFFAYTTEYETAECRLIDAESIEKPGGGIRMHNKIKEMSKTVLVGAIVMFLTSIFLLVSCLGWRGVNFWLHLFMTYMYYTVIIMLMPKAFAIFFERVYNKENEMRDFSKHLGAKNAVENAYYDLGRVPNMEEVSKYSIYASECKYTKNAPLASLVCILYCVHFLSGLWYWIIAISSILTILLLEAMNLLAVWQWLVVSKPDEEHYKVAIKALEKTVKFIDVVKGPKNFDEDKSDQCLAYDFCENASKKK